jgi:hypothetical protein
MHRLVLRFLLGIAFGRQQSKIEDGTSSSEVIHNPGPLTLESRKNAFVPGSMNNFGPTIGAIEPRLPGGRVELPTKGL